MAGRQQGGQPSSEVQLNGAWTAQGSAFSTVCTYIQLNFAAQHPPLPACSGWRPLRPTGRLCPGSGVVHPPAHQGAPRLGGALPPWSTARQVRSAALTMASGQV